MESAAAIGAKRRGYRRWRRAAALLIGLPALALLLGNLCLSSPWSRRWLASKIQARTGLEARVSAISWTPWGGAALGGLELLQPEPLRPLLTDPLVKIKTLRLSPVWQAWLRGRYEIRSISLESPRVVLPVELLSYLAGSASPPAPSPVASPPGATAPPPPPTAMAPPDPVVSPPPQAALPPRPTGWLHLQNASFTLVHAGSRRTLIEISAVRGSVPVSGDAAASAFRIGQVAVGGKEIAAQVATTLEWRPPQLSLKPVETKIGGFPFLLAAKIATLGGLPLQIEAKLPRQPLAALDLPMDSRVGADSVSASLRFRGLLLAPGTWQGDLVAEAESPTLHLAGHETKFDRGSTVTVLRGGIFSCVDARLTGDALSLLGNGTLLADGRVAAAARIVAPPETAASIAKRVFPNIPGDPALTPLATPQRAAFDVELSGRLGQLRLRLGHDGPILNFSNPDPP